MICADPKLDTKEGLLDSIDACRLLERFLSVLNMLRYKHIIKITPPRNTVSETHSGPDNPDFFAAASWYTTGAITMKEKTLMTHTET